MRPLDGIRVLDFGRYVAGPYCAALLADFGADVIRIEPPGGGEDREVTPITSTGEGAVFIQVNRNKRSLAFDPRGAGAEDVRNRLVRSADVVIANMPDAVLTRLGIAYEELKAIKSDIILSNTSSFGPDGPWADRPGFDSVGQAMCGSAYLTGMGDVPYRTPMTWVDHSSGLFAAFGIMMALFERQRTGGGQQVSSNLLGSAVAFSSAYLLEQAAIQPHRAAIGNRSFVNGPTDSFRTRDGWIVTQVVGSPIFRRWAALMEEPDLATDPRFASDRLRGENGAILSARMQAWCDTRTSAEALAELSEARIPAAPVLSPQEVLDHPQVQALGMFHETMIDGLDRPVPLVGTPLSLSGSSADTVRRPPLAGEHSLDVLREIGFDDAEIAELLATGTVWEPSDG